MKKADNSEGANDEEYHPLEESVAPAEDMLQQASDRAAVLIQRQFRSSWTQSSSSSLSATAVALSDMPDVTETTYYEDEDDQDFTEETKEKEAGAAMTMVAPKVLGAVMGGGSPVDEDDLMLGAMITLQGNAGGGGAGGGGSGGVGAGAGAGAGAATASTAQ
jgi:hypothetical protein